MDDYYLDDGFNNRPYFQRTTLVKHTKKEHGCMDCGKAIPTGSRVWYSIDYTPEDATPHYGYHCALQHWPCVLFMADGSLRTTTWELK